MRNPDDKGPAVVSVGAVARRVRAAPGRAIVGGIVGGILGAFVVFGLSGGAWYPIVTSVFAVICAVIGGVIGGVFLVSGVHDMRGANGGFFGGMVGVLAGGAVAGIVSAFIDNVFR